MRWTIRCERCDATIECDLQGIDLSATDLFIAKLDYAAEAGWKRGESGNINMGILGHHT